MDFIPLPFVCAVGGCCLVLEYPRVTFQRFERRYKCMVCDYDEGKYVVYGNAKAQRSPCVFCTECYKSFHLSQSGQVLYDDCQVYEYPSGVPRET